MTSDGRRSAVFWAVVAAWLAGSIGLYAWGSGSGPPCGPPGVSFAGKALRYGPLVLIAAQLICVSHAGRLTGRSRWTKGLAAVGSVIVLIAGLLAVFVQFAVAGHCFGG